MKSGPKPRPLAERFVAMIEMKTGDECWEWKGCVDRRGHYGRMRLNGETVPAYRVAWMLFNNSAVPDGMAVIHRCNNSRCVNPNHLFLGVNGDQNRDKYDKRSLGKRGELNGQHKLESSRVHEIRRRYKEGNISQRDLAQEYGVCQSTICCIVKRWNWGWLDEDNIG